MPKTTARTVSLAPAGPFSLAASLEYLETFTPAAHRGSHRGFRGSAEYGRWRALLHHFYEPFPVVEHFAPVLDGFGPRTPGRS
ncbi:hypothetical protein ACTD5D_27605 [Nocardia takedensis]|uniref:hypothetical protein n=1 Tax=Nocardia takedensis TaxID=259390 RepID=UPI0002DDBC03|nr:hypothetical protein [Nocardia takedensis]